jgi:hypothetical protein
MFVGAIPKAEGICGDDQPCLFLASYSPNKIELKGGLPRRLVSEQKWTAVFTQGRFSEQLYQNSSAHTSVEHCSQCSETQRFWYTVSQAQVLRPQQRIYQIRLRSYFDGDRSTEGRSSI